MLSVYLTFLHKGIREQSVARSKCAIAIYNGAAHILTTNFVFRNFSLFCKPIKSLQELVFLWTDPQRFIAVKSLAVCVVQDHIAGKENTLHVTLMCRYDGLTEGNRMPKDVLNVADQTVAKYRIFVKIVDFDRNAEAICLKAQWDRLPDKRDFT